MGRWEVNSEPLVGEHVVSSSMMTDKWKVGKTARQKHRTWSQRQHSLIVDHDRVLLVQTDVAVAHEVQRKSLSILHGEGELSRHLGAHVVELAEG